MGQSRSRGQASVTRYLRSLVWSSLFINPKRGSWLFELLRTLAGLHTPKQSSDATSLGSQNEAGYRGETEALVKTHCNLPEGAIPIAVFEVVSYFDKDGDNMWVYRRAGDITTTGLVGLIETSKFDMLRRSMEEMFDDEDDD